MNHGWPCFAGPATTDTKPLETARTSLRLLGDQDVELYIRIYTDTEMMRHVCEPFTIQRARGAFEMTLAHNRARSSGLKTWVVHRRDIDNELGLLALNVDGRRAEIGALILPQWQNMGFSTELINRLVEYAFHEQGVDLVYTRHRMSNGQADGLMKKLNFVRVPPQTEDAGQVRWERAKM